MIEEASELRICPLVCVLQRISLLRKGIKVSGGCCLIKLQCLLRLHFIHIIGLILVSRSCHQTVIELVRGWTCCIFTITMETCYARQKRVRMVDILESHSQH
jgi:hypothetical protein